MYGINFLVMSDTTFTPGQSWGALKKCWRGYKLAKGDNDAAKMKEFASRIRTLQKQLGLAVTAFPELAGSEASPQ